MCALRYAYGRARTMAPRRRGGRGGSLFVVKVSEVRREDGIVCNAIAYQKARQTPETGREFSSTREPYRDSGQGSGDLPLYRRDIPVTLVSTLCTARFMARSALSYT